MNLRICKEVLREDDCMPIPYSWLTDNGVHLFIASNRWDTLTVELSDEIPSDVLKYVVTKCNNVSVKFTQDDITQKSMDLLCELFPDKAGSLRKAKMLGKNIKSMLL